MATTAPTTARATTAAAVMANGNSGMIGDDDAKGLALTKDNAPTTMIADRANNNAKTTGIVGLIRSSSFSLMNEISQCPCL